MNEIIVGLVVMAVASLLFWLIGKPFINIGWVEGYFELFMYSTLIILSIMVVLLVAWLIGYLISFTPGIKG